MLLKDIAPKKRRRSRSRRKTTKSETDSAKHNPPESEE